MARVSSWLTTRPQREAGLSGSQGWQNGPPHIWQVERWTPCSSSLQTQQKTGAEVWIKVVTALPHNIDGG